LPAISRIPAGWAVSVLRSSYVTMLKPLLLAGCAAAALAAGVRPESAHRADMASFQKGLKAAASALGVPGVKKAVVRCDEGCEAHGTRGR
jgi:hypothetical protein